MRYVFTNKGILSVFESVDENNRKKIIKYTPENIPKCINMVKEVAFFQYKNKLTTKEEFTASSRKFLNEILSITCDDNESFTVLSEWESIHGENLLLLSESTEELLIEQKVSDSWDYIVQLTEAWYNPFSSDFIAYRPFTWAYDKTKKVAKAYKEGGITNVLSKTGKWAYNKVKNIYNAVKDGIVAAWNCLTGNFVECLMEGLRSIVYSVLGAGVLTAVSFIPVVGQVTNGIIFGALVIWDIYKMLSGKYESGKYAWSWLQIIMDAVSLALPLLGKSIGKLAGSFAGKAGQSLSTVLAKAKTIPVLGKAITAVSNTISSIIGVIKRAATFIGQKLGIQWLVGYGAKAEVQLSKLAGGGAKAATKGGAQVAKGGVQVAKGGAQVATELVSKIPSKGVIIRGTAGSMLLTGAICGYLGLDDWTCQEKAQSGELTPEEVKKAQEALDEKTADALANQPLQPGVDYPI